MNQPPPSQHNVSSLSCRIGELESRLASLERLAGRTPAQADSQFASAAPPPKGTPPTPAKQQNYALLIERIRGVVDHHVPNASIVTVISRGDDELLKLGERRGWHFPRNAAGVYAGHNPANSAEAVQHLEKQRESGAQYLVIPATGLWWLDHYREFAQYLRASYRQLYGDPKVCVLFELKIASRAPQGAGDRQVPPGSSRHLQAMIDALLPAQSMVAILSADGTERTEKVGRGMLFLPSSGAGKPVNGAMGCIEDLKQAKTRGARFLMVTLTGLVWVEGYPELAAYLNNQCRVVQVQPHVATIFELLS